MIEQKMLDWFMGFLRCEATTGQELSSLRYLEEHAGIWLGGDDCAGDKPSAHPFWQRQMITEDRYNLYADFSSVRRQDALDVANGATADTNTNIATDIHADNACTDVHIDARTADVCADAGINVNSVQSICSGDYCQTLPRLIFCSHIDTVPPYSPPSCTDQVVYGRGSCDAKGQIFTILLTVRRLMALGLRDFGVLLTVGEERDSCGAKLANRVLGDQRKNGACNQSACEAVHDTNTLAASTSASSHLSAERYVIVLEPTCNRLITAAKGSIRLHLQFAGQSAHSGYPERGLDAIQDWARFNQRLLAHHWELDQELGETTFNWGELYSSNADNVVPQLVTCNLHCRTTFASHAKILPQLQAWLPAGAQLEVLVNRAPFRFKTVTGFQEGTVAYGCDAPYLDRLGHPMLYGPGDILVAHGADEQLALEAVERAVDDLVCLSQRLLCNA